MFWDPWLYTNTRSLHYNHLPFPSKQHLWKENLLHNLLYLNKTVNTYFKVYVLFFTPLLFYFFSCLLFLRVLKEWNEMKLIDYERLEWNVTKNNIFYLMCSTIHRRCGDEINILFYYHTIDILFVTKI